MKSKNETKKCHGNQLVILYPVPDVHSGMAAMDIDDLRNSTQPTR